jgi:hypothetical protein
MKPWVAAGAALACAGAVATAVSLSAGPSTTVALGSAVAQAPPDVAAPEVAAPEAERTPAGASPSPHLTCYAGITLEPGGPVHATAQEALDDFRVRSGQEAARLDGDPTASEVERGRARALHDGSLRLRFERDSGGVVTFRHVEGEVVLATATASLGAGGWALSEVQATAPPEVCAPPGPSR